MASLPDSIRFIAHSQWTADDRPPAADMLFALEGILVWVAAQDRIQIFNPAEIWTYGNIFQRTFVCIRPLGRIPWARILLPRDVPCGCCQVYIQIAPFEFPDFRIHVLLSSSHRVLAGFSGA